MRRPVVNYKLTAVGFVLAIAVRRERAYEFALSAAYIERTAHLYGNIAAILVVDYIFERNDYIVDRGGACNAVDLVVDGDKTDAEKRKNRFQILARLYIVSAEARQILYDNAVDFFVCRVLYHTLKVGAVEIGAAEAVVGIAIEKLHIGALFRKAL